MALIFSSISNDPFFNTATEEYLFREFEEDIIFIWRNQTSVLIGKHQNALAEINYPVLLKKNIPLIRRLTGGGTVYHDLGNINFSFIFNNQGKQFDFKFFINPIIEFLNSIGISAETDARNAIYSNGKKITGTAQHIFKSRIIFHGTLLHNVNVGLMHELLMANGKYSDKAVKSVRASVGSIDEQMSVNYLTEELIEMLVNFFKRKFIKVDSLLFSNDQVNRISDVYLPKYKKWEWNYAYSPTYQFENRVGINGSTILLKLVVKSGVIQTIEMKDFSGNDYMDTFSPLFINQRHDYCTLYEIIQNNIHIFNITEEQIDIFVHQFF